VLQTANTSYMMLQPPNMSYWKVCPRPKYMLAQGSLRRIYALLTTDGVVTASCAVNNSGLLDDGGGVDGGLSGHFVCFGLFGWCLWVENVFGL